VLNPARVAVPQIRVRAVNVALPVPLDCRGCRLVKPLLALNRPRCDGARSEEPGQEHA